MKAILVTGPNEFSLQEREEPIRNRDEVGIKVRMVGICGSDLHLLRGRIPFAKYPLVPGHEYMGEVLYAPAKTKLKKGDKVTVFPGVGCGKCSACKDGRMVHCTAYGIAGTTLPGGGFCERVVVPYRRVFSLPRRMDDELGAMTEPTAVAVHVNRRANLRQGMKVVIIGGGVIGLLVAQVARVFGASAIVLSEPIAERREIAKRLGFRMLCDPGQKNLPSFVRDTIGLADVVFDVVATRQTLQDSQTMLCPNGKLILVGFPHDRETGIPYIPAFFKELQVIACRSFFMRDFPEAIRLLSSRKIDVKPMISQTFPLEKFSEAIDCLEKMPDKYMKVLVRPST